MNKYLDRTDAGKVLAEQLKAYANRSDVIVLALPRGGVPVGYEIAKALSLPLDVFIVRKLGVPGHEELAMGAVATGDVSVFNDDILHQLHISQAAIENVLNAETKELKRRERVYRGNKPFPDLVHKTIILVDDGIATGATMRAAIKSLYQFNPATIVMAVPVSDRETCEKMALLVDKVVCPLQVDYFYAVGAWYEEFDQTTDDEVRQLLADIK